MKLYYYTTVETLALILDSHKLRFTRLDCFDDPKEAESYSDFNQLIYIFASCFTEDEKESIPLWKMYSSIETGVRIEFDQETMFSPKQTPIVLPKNSYKTIIHQSIVHSTLTSNQLHNNDYSCIPVSGKVCDYIDFQKVIYNDDYKELYAANQNIGKHTTNTDNPNIERTNTHIRFNPTKYGYYKSSYWSFQNESRFLIYTIPFATNEKEFSKMVFENKSLTTRYIDVQLSDECISNLIIRTAPKATPATKIIIRSLVQKYPKINIESSELEDCIR